MTHRKAKIITYALALFLTAGFLLGLVSWQIIKNCDSFLSFWIGLWNAFVLFKHVFIGLGIGILVFLCFVLFVKLYDAINEPEV